MKTLGLENKNILVTGANGFLGRYICAALKEEGAKVIGIDIDDSEYSIKCDITDSQEIQRLARFHKVDGIVNNAAKCVYGQVSVSDYDTVMKTNIAGTDNVIQAFEKYMGYDAGIVNVASVYGMLSPDFSIYGDNPKWFNPSIYGATKAAIIQLTKYYAVRLAPIRVNTVSPGGIFNNHDKDFDNKYSLRVPLKRMGKPEEIVNAILFLLSPLSSYITGHNLVVSGGLDIW